MVTNTRSQNGYVRDAKTAKSNAKSGDTVFFCQRASEPLEEGDNDKETSYSYLPVFRWSLKRGNGKDAYIQPITEPGAWQFSSPK